MKNKSAISLCLISSFALANEQFLVIVNDDDFKVKETYAVIIENSEWTDQNNPYNCSVSPLNSDYYKGVEFEQDEVCDQDQNREVKTYHQSYTSGEKTLVNTEIETQTVNTFETNTSFGDYLASTCQEVVEYGGKDGDKVYETTKGNIFCDMDYNDGTGYERTHLYKPNQTLLGGCTTWTDTRAEFCSNYTETLSFSLNKTSKAYMEYVTYNFANTAHDSNTSIITVDGIDKSYHLVSPVLHSIDLSGNSNGSKIMTIRFTHDATNPGDNNMGVREIYLYEQ